MGSARGGRMHIQLEALERLREFRGEVHLFIDRRDDARRGWARVGAPYHGRASKHSCAAHVGKWQFSSARRLVLLMRGITR